jgi:hypothetical protein
LEGTLEGIDAERKHLTVKAKGGKEPVNVRLETDTKIRIGDKDGAASDLKPGDPVMVMYETKERTNVAKTVTVLAKS